MARKFLVDSFITHVLPFGKVTEGFDLSCSGTSICSSHQRVMSISRILLLPLEHTPLFQPPHLCSRSCLHLACPLRMPLTVGISLGLQGPTQTRPALDSPLTHSEESLPSSELLSLLAVPLGEHMFLYTDSNLRQNPVFLLRNP